MITNIILIVTAIVFVLLVIQTCRLDSARHSARIYYNGYADLSRRIKLQDQRNDTQYETIKDLRQVIKEFKIK